MLGPLPRLTIEAPNLAKVAKVIGESPQRWSDWRPAWLQLLPHLQEGLAENVNTVGASLGARFPELAASTIYYRARLGIGMAPLVGRTHELIESVGTPSVARRKLTKTRLKVGPKGDRHLFVMHYGSKGAGRGRRTVIPARRWIGISPAMRAVSIAVMNAHARAQLEAMAKELRRVSGGG